MYRGRILTFHGKIFGGKGAFLQFSGEKKKNADKKKMGVWPRGGGGGNFSFHLGGGGNKPPFSLSQKFKGSILLYCWKI